MFATMPGSTDILTVRDQYALLTLRVITVIDIADRTDIYHPGRV